MGVDANGEGIGIRLDGEDPLLQRGEFSNCYTDHVGDLSDLFVDVADFDCEVGHALFFPRHPNVPASVSRVEVVDIGLNVDVVILECGHFDIESSRVVLEGNDALLKLLKFVIGSSKKSAE